MHALAAPILAQVVTLSAGDRVEGRYVTEESERRFESDNNAFAGASARWDFRRSSLGIGYFLGFTVVPLEEEPREFLLVHSALLEAQHRFKRTTLTLSQSASYGERNFYAEALAGSRVPSAEPAPSAPGAAPAPGGEPATPGGDPGAAGPEQPDAGAARAARQTVSYWSFVSGATVEHRFSRATRGGARLGYTVSGGADDASRVLYPLTRGPDAGADVAYSLFLNPRDTLTTTISLSAAARSPGGSRSAILGADETWYHRFSSRTNSELGGGFAYTVSTAEGEPVAHSVFPTGLAAINHTDRLARGTLSLRLAANVSPVLDYTTASVDPRFGVAASAGWVRGPLSLTANASAAISLKADDDGALNSVSATAGAAYELGLGFAAETGVRGFWQTFEGATVIPPSSAVFVALRWNGAVTLFER